MNDTDGESVTKYYQNYRTLDRVIVLPDFSK